MELSKIEPSSDGAAFLSSHGRKDDDAFFMDDSFVVILIENVFFRLPAHQLRKVSKFFEETISCTLASDSPGFSRENPLDLTKDASAAEFRILLKLLFNDDVYNQHPEHTYGKSDWLVVLQLSSAWNIPYCRHLAIKHLERQRGFEVDSMEHVEWGRKYAITDFLRDGYIGLISREPIIEVADINLLGCETIVKLFQLREREQHRRRSRFIKGSPEEDVEQTFAEVLGEVKSREKIFWDERVGKIRIYTPSSTMD